MLDGVRALRGNGNGVVEGLNKRAKASFGMLTYHTVSQAHDVRNNMKRARRLSAQEGTGGKMEAWHALLGLILVAQAWLQNE